MITPLVNRAAFPIFTAHPELTYLDSAATAQKPATVIEAETRFYATSNANVHRGIYRLAEQATTQFEAARATVAQFVDGQSDEIVFTKGATEAINLVAQSFVRPRLEQIFHSGSGRSVAKQPQIITTIAEHHSNFVPWQQLAKETGATLTVVPLRGLSSSSRTPTRRGSDIKDPGNRRQILKRVQDDKQEQPWEIDLDFLESTLKERPTAIVAVADVGNVLGTVNPTAKIIELAHAHGVPVLVDAAQSLAHLPVNVRRINADFLVGSGHKLYGPTGIGFLWAKRDYLEAMVPYQFGGEMIRSVTVKKATWADSPQKFEAGTPNIAGAIGLAAALDWLATIDNSPLSQRGVGRDFGSSRANQIPLTPPLPKGEVRPNWDAIANHEEALLTYTDEQLRKIPGLTILGPPNPRDRAGLIAFTIDSIHPHDLATILDEKNIAVRAGHHCAQPLHDFLGLPASTRVSFGVYSSSDDISRLIDGIQVAQTIVCERRKVRS